MPKTITDLNDHLFAVIDALRDPVTPMELERAEQIGCIADRIIRGAMAEVRYIAVTGDDGSGFFPPSEALPEPARPRLIPGHR